MPVSENRDARRLGALASDFGALVNRSSKNASRGERARGRRLSDTADALRI
jgi:hypothetical protein